MKRNEEEDLIKKKDPEEEPPKRVEISKEAEQDRLFLSGMLIQQKEELLEAARRRKRKTEEETFELRSGVVISIAGLNAIISAHVQPYAPQFPNSIPFFSEIYRLNQWTHIKPTDYVKPAIVGKWINEIIYSRYSREVLPTLRVLNPALPDGLRKFKHFQFLTEEGQAKLLQYRDEAIALMKESSSWIEFREKLLRKYGVPYQSDLFRK